MASRVESTGVAGGVHISSAAWAQMELPDGLATRRTLDIKGKAAPMDTFLLAAGSQEMATAKAVLLARWPQSAVAAEGSA